MMKKNDMNTIEKAPTAMLATTEATEPMTLEMPEKLVTSLSLAMM